MLGSGCMSPAPRSPGCSFPVEATIVPPPSYSPGISKLLTANIEQPLILELPAGATGIHRSSQLVAFTICS